MAIAVSPAVTVALVLLALALAGCASTPVSPEQRLLNACSDYTGAFDAVVTHGELGNLTLAQLEMLREATEVPTAICEGDMTAPDGTPMTVPEAIKAVEDAYIDLIAMQQGGA